MRRIHFHHARRDSQCHVIQNNALQDEHPMWWLKDEALARRTRDRTFNSWRQVSRPGQDSSNRLLHDACWFQPCHHQKKPLGLLSLEQIPSKPSCTTLKIPTSRDKPPKLTTTTPNHLAIPAGESRGDSSAQPRKKSDKRFNLPTHRQACLVAAFDPLGSVINACMHV
jgi:hypothetical protein